ncbi:SAM-dependent methyltransferase [Planotetraspora sp. GP83]
MRMPPSSGSGPGPIAPDGCAVEFYVLLPPGEDPAIIQAAAGDGRTILDLGSGPGRIAHALAALGFSVVAVDESPDMLARVVGVETVCARIQDLRLDRRFDTVLLASYLVNTPDDHERRRLLDTCRHHLAEDGGALIQWQPAEIQDAWVRGQGGTKDGMTFTMTELSRPAPDLVSATMRYEVGPRTWTHSFTTRRLTQDALKAELRAAGLVVDVYLTPDRTWLRAVPAA